MWHYRFIRILIRNKQRSDYMLYIYTIIWVHDEKKTRNEGRLYLGSEWWTKRWNKNPKPEFIFEPSKTLSNQYHHDQHHLGTRILPTVDHPLVDLNTHDHHTLSQPTYTRFSKLETTRKLAAECRIYLGFCVSFVCVKSWLTNEEGEGDIWGDESEFSTDYKGRSNDQISFDFFFFSWI